MLSSRIMLGLVLHRGDLSWFNKSISSFVTNLDREILRSVKFWVLILPLPTWWPAAILSACIVPQCAPLSQIRTRPLAWQGTRTHRRSRSPWPSVSPPLEQQQLQNKPTMSGKNILRSFVGSILQTHDSMPFKLVTSSILRRKSNCWIPAVRWLKPFIIETCSFKIFVINNRQSGISSNL